MKLGHRRTSPSLAGGPIRKPASRAGFLVFHRCLALAFAPLLLLQALTGAALLFKGPLGRMLDPVGMTRQSETGIAPPSALLASAEQQLPGYRAARIFFAEAPEDIAFVQLSGPDGTLRYAALDPGSAKALAAGPVWRFPLEAALQLHYRLMDGRTGLAIVLVNGLALALMAGTGLGFWWPGRDRLAQSLAIRSSAPTRLRLRQWHRTCGVFAAMLVLFSAATGLLLVAPDLNDALAESASPTTPAPLPPRTPAQIDRAVALAAAQFPGAALRDIRLPLADRLDINFFAPERGPRAVHVVSVALSTAKVARVLPASANPVLWMKVLPLHTGDVFGLTGRLLLLGEAMALAFLALSGPLMWWRARAKGG